MDETTGIKVVNSHSIYFQPEKMALNIAGKMETCLFKFLRRQKGEISCRLSIYSNNLL